MYATKRSSNKNNYLPRNLKKFLEENNALVPFVKNCMKHGTECYRFEKPDPIIWAFNWARAPEGGDYWRLLSNKWEGWSKPKPKDIIVKVTCQSNDEYYVVDYDEDNGERIEIPFTISAALQKRILELHKACKSADADEISVYDRSFPFEKFTEDGDPIRVVSNTLHVRKSGNFYWDATVKGAYIIIFSDEISLKTLTGK